MLFCFEDVNKFQIKFGVPMPDIPMVLNNEAYNFRVGFLREEQQEFIESHQKKDFVGCIDALLDEVYVACGTSLMMGIDNTRWLIAFDKSRFEDNDQTFLESKLPRKHSPSFLCEEDYNNAITLMGLNLNKFIHHHFYGNIDGCTQSMVGLVSLCYSIANIMGINWSTWREMWDDVQRANMSKVRVTDASQSKRKTSLDVIKPPGWVGPDGGKILDLRYPGWRNKVTTNI